MIRNLTFKGVVNEDGERRVYWQEAPSLEWVRLDPRFDLRNHSPDGFSWGYGGSGPAQLALAILCMVIGDEAAQVHYQDFKFAAIAKLDQGSNFIIDTRDIMQFIPAKA